MTIFTPVSPEELEGYRIVYQGGHHDVYCNGETHLRTTGGRVNAPPNPPLRRTDYKWPCDCHKYKG